MAGRAAFGAIGLAGLMMSAGLPASAQDRGPSFNLYGNTGLIDLPTAEGQADGQLTWTYGLFGNTERGGINFQILPWVSGTVRYSNIDDFDEPGDTEADRSFDLRFQLAEEGRWTPALAVGFRDFLGDSPYGAEYLVATKTLVPGLKATAGLGWGRLATADGIDLGNDRPGLTDPRGQVQTDTFFRGDAAVFGGVEWQTPVAGLSVKAEYSTDAYTQESRFSDFERRSPWNLGLTYRPNDSVQLSGYYMYGDTVGFQISLTGNPNKPLTPQDLGAGPVPLNARSDDAPRGTDWAKSRENRDKLVSALQEVLASEGVRIEEARITGRMAHLYVVNGRTPREPKAIGRTARVMAVGLPASVETFRITLIDGDLPVTTVELKRSDLERQVDRPDASLKTWQTARLSDAAASLEGDAVWRRDDLPSFGWSLNPKIPFDLFDPDEPVRPDVSFRARANYQVTRGLSFSAEVSQWLIGTDEVDESTSDSTLPKVRSDARIYNSGRDPALSRLTGDYVFKLNPQTYGRVSAGYLERMFAGVSTEVLWKPTEQSWGLGAELNYARQRDFDDFFALQDYDIVTGHASVYWDTGYYGLEAQVDAGRYLAGDWGATFTLTRRFANGWEVSGYFTRTDVSFEEFGSGSFSKGVSISLPLRWGLPYESKSSASIDLGSISSDAGARLRVSGRLYERIKNSDADSLERNWGSFWQ